MAGVGLDEVKGMRGVESWRVEWEGSHCPSDPFTYVQSVSSPYMIGLEQPVTYRDSR